MKSGTRRRAAILTAVMLLSGCGTTPNGGTSGSGGMLTWQQANEEYKATVEDFPFELMNGDAFPANIPKAQAASSLYAKGSGEGQAYVYWQCSVERDILDNSQTNAEAARGALQQLRKLLDTDWFKNYYTSYNLTVSTESGYQSGHTLVPDTNPTPIFVRPNTKLYLSGKATKTNGVEVEFPKTEIGVTAARTWHSIEIDAGSAGQASLDLRFDDTPTTVETREIELNPEA